MNNAASFPWPGTSPTDNTTFRAIFEHASLPVARCDRKGTIVEMNPAFERTVNRHSEGRLTSLRLHELLPPQERRQTDSLLDDLLGFRKNNGQIVTSGSGPGASSASRWTAWRQPGNGITQDHVLVCIDPTHDTLPAEESLLQSQRWEAVGRLAGGVVHDFNNLLTGIMLYCDLLLPSLDVRDRRRRYADEIRSAVVQSSALVRQLLVFAHPRSEPASPISLNDTATTMRDLLTRLSGENIRLDLHLDAELGLVKIDQAQVQQILLNLVLNARDAMPEGGRITIETSNCNFQPVPGSITKNSSSGFPCVLLLVSDNGCGMNAETRQRLFEPFFTTKNAGKGTGLGLTTVHSIVTTNRGLIHFESEPGRGTRVMILLPRASDLPTPALPQTELSNTECPAEEQFQEVKKESLL